MGVGGIGVVLMLCALLMWGNSSINPVGAQTPPPSEAEQVLPAALRVSKTTDWGSYTASALTLHGTARSQAEGKGQSNARSVQNVRTTPTVDDVTRHVGWGHFEFSFLNPDGHTITHYAVERRIMLPDMDPAMGWRVLVAYTEDRSFTDYDVIATEWYEYRIMVHGTHVTTGDAMIITTGNIEYLARPILFLSGIATDGTVEIEVRSNGATFWGDQSVTVTRYDHMERTASTGVEIVTQDVLLGEHVMYRDVLTRSPRLSPGYPMVAGPLANRNCRPLRPWRLSNGSLMSCGTRRSWST